ncbi:phosphoribosylanthranilate isomerase [Aciduricibacillus chroicocephali]|uniref:N-(5'-phosphoribosyl)anthranilate isomerase n=1 Tax=Aciduricibacillus chroicocephali TaxID=3054939 RepID=A0ABY9KW27_9BACI|nr:phosphoribosylanthranilate isomerase [Bacillaceae bacterium 44XB]
MLVKICGIQTIEHAEAAVGAGADLLGFVFAPSKRQIEPARAKVIISTLPDSVQTVGVFVNESKSRMSTIAEEAGLDYIQLHGDEDTSIAESLPYKIIKAFPVTEETLPTIQDYPADYYILDSPIGGARGGNGTVFDWDLAKDLPIDRNKIILAGGLDHNNVQEAIKRLSPIGVDVSSGVETAGVKDSNKIRQFIKTAKTK